MIGKKFGHLTVITEGEYRVYASGQRFKTWECKCDCGRSTEVIESKLNSGHTTSCGCARGGLQVLTGKRFGRLLVIARDGLVTKSPAWLCQCDCGNTKRVRGDYLRAGSAKSCGCFQIENRKKKGRWKIRKSVCLICGKDFEYSSSIKPNCCSDRQCYNKYQANYQLGRTKLSLERSIGRLVISVKSRSKKLGSPCDISTQYMNELLQRQDRKCARTGLPFVISDHNGTGAKSPWSPSIDQIDPGEGYTKENVQLVCCMYNFCKHTWKDEAIVEFSRAILKFGKHGL